jgi:hypothetical protein
MSRFPFYSFKALFMKRFLDAALVMVLVTFLGNLVRAEDKDPMPVLDKAIKALGGEDKLKKVVAASWKGKLTLLINGSSNDMTTQSTVQGLDHYRSEFEGEFGGNPVKGVTVLNGDKGWRRFGDNKSDMDEEAVASEKRQIYLQVIPSLILPLKGKGFKLEAVADQKVGEKSAAGVKATGTDGKDFTIYFDKENGLPVKLVAKVVGWQGDEFTQETVYSDYKDFDGIRRATKSDSKRDGEDFIKYEVTEFKVLSKVDPKTFAEPD